MRLAELFPTRWNIALKLAAALVAAMPTPGEAAPEGELCASEPTNMLIEYGDLLRCLISPAGDRDVFRFAGSISETIRVQLADRSSLSARPCFEVRDPTGNPLGPLACGDARRDFVLQRNGAYRIVVTEDVANGAQAVNYAVLVERINPTSPAGVPIQFGQIRDSEIGRQGDVDAYFFEAEADDEIAVRIVDQTPGPRTPCYQIYDPQGMSLPGRICGTRTQRFLLSQAGRYSILIDEDLGGGQGLATYRLRLSCVSGVCPRFGFDDVLGCISLRGAPLRDVQARFTQPGEGGQTEMTDVRGCARFMPVDGKEFRLRVAGPEVTD